MNCHCAITLLLIYAMLTTAFAYMAGPGVQRGYSRGIYAEPSAALEGQKASRLPYIQVPENFLRKIEIENEKGSEDNEEVAAVLTDKSARKKKAKPRMNYDLRIPKELLSEATSLLLKGQISEVLDIIEHKTMTLNNVELNYLTARIMKVLDAPDLALYCIRIIDKMESLNTEPDIYTYTSAMSVLNKYRSFDSAMQIYEKVIERGLPLDEKVYVNTARAAGHAKPWEYTLLVLDEAHSLLGESVIPVVHTALANLNYVDVAGNQESGEPSNGELSAQTLVLRAQELLNWLKARQVQPKAQTFDIVLAVVCKYGSVADVESVLQAMDANRLRPTQFTFNTLLNHCVLSEEAEGAVHVLAAMKGCGIDPDVATCNTLLKMCAKNNDIDGANKVLESMSQMGMSQTEYTKSMMMQLYAASGMKQAAIDIIAKEDGTEVTSHMFASAISNVGEWEFAVDILDRAVKLQKADGAVFGAAIKACISHKQYIKGFTIINDLLRRDSRIDKYLFSTIITACVQFEKSGGRGAHLLDKYVQVVHSKFPELLSDSICQKVVKELSGLNHASLASSIHLKYLSQYTCSSDVLLLLFANMQMDCSREADVKLKRKKAMEALSIIGLYTMEKKDAQGHNSARSPQKILKTTHFDHVLRILSEAKMFEEEEQVFYMMRNSTTGSQSDYSSIKDLTEAEQPNTSIWMPSTFTIAEFVRTARRAGNPTLAADVLLWGLERAVMIPEGVISDCLAFLFQRGELELVSKLYSRLYEAGKVEHWADRESLEMDLHRFNRGMAYGAMFCAIEESKEMQEAMQNAGTEDNFPNTLTIITGKNIKIRGSESITVIDSTGEKEGAYVLVKQVQDILVECFYPPISSSTIPGNPGRITVILETEMQI